MNSTTYLQGEVLRLHGEGGRGSRERQHCKPIVHFVYSNIYKFYIIIINMIAPNSNHLLTINALFYWY